ncbi:MAG: PKD domain-containing protein, partial [Aeoliella sp.]
VEGDTVTLTADFTDAGVLDTHTATIDWGDGTSTAGVVDQLLGTVTGDHVYANGGIYEATITLTDDDTGEATEATAAVVAGVGENDGVLQAVGTDGNDFVKVFRNTYSGDYKVLFRLDGGAWTWRTFDGTSVDKIEMLLGDGDDIGFVSRKVHINATIDSGDGDDLLGGGSGDDVLLAGAGYDLLFGGAGRDLMIGGTGSDLIFGDGGSDILISGTTAFDNNSVALDAIMAEWTSERTYQERSDNLRGIVGDTFDDRENGEVFLIAEGPLATVFDDESTDWLIGGRGRDLYFAGDDDVSFARFGEIIEEIEAEDPA